MRAVSENIIFGQLAPIGTGVMDIHMDDTREVDETSGNLGICALDHGTPTLPSLRKNELFSMASPLMEEPAMNTPMPGETPYPEAEDVDIPMSDDTIANMATPMVSPGDDDVSGQPGLPFARSPFSPQAEVGRGARASPFSDMMASPASVAGGYSPIATDMSSPATPSRTPTSPTYSPAMPEDATAATPHYQPMSPTYSPASPAYTPSSSQFHTSTSGARTSLASSSPAYQPRARYDMTSPAAQGMLPGGVSPAFSPTYSPSAVSSRVADKPPGYDGMALTSPMYTPMSSQYTPTSPVYTPTSPPMEEPVGRAARGRRSAYGADTSPITSPRLTEGLMGDTSPVVELHELPSASPQIQNIAPDSPGVPTSPSYTPHEEPPLFQGEARRGDGEAGPLLFERYDDEDAELAYSPIPLAGTAPARGAGAGSQGLD